jgi:hypothetical protein
VTTRNAQPPRTVEAGPAPPIGRVGTLRIGSCEGVTIVSARRIEHWSYDRPFKKADLVVKPSVPAVRQFEMRA